MALLHVNFYSDILEMETEMEVILPQVTAKNPRFETMREDVTYPVLYLLHGMNGNQTSWIRKTRKEYWEGVFGPTSKAKGSQNDLLALADQLAGSGRPRPKMYMWCGTEDFIYGQNVNARDHFIKAGFDLTYEESPGTHEWVYWDEKIQRVLQWLPLIPEAVAE